MGPVIGWGPLAAPGSLYLEPTAPEGQLRVKSWARPRVRSGPPGEVLSLDVLDPPLTQDDCVQDAAWIAEPERHGAPWERSWSCNGHGVLGRADLPGSTSLSVSPVTRAGLGAELDLWGRSLGQGAPDGPRGTARDTRGLQRLNRRAFPPNTWLQRGVDSGQRPSWEGPCSGRLVLLWRMCSGDQGHSPTAPCAL